MAGILPLMERYNNTPVKDTIKKVYETISEMLSNQVFKATKLHKIIRFDYRSIKETSYKNHELHPYKICNQKDDWYILGFSPEHGKFKTFSLARMKNIELEEDFTPDPDYRKRIHIDPNFGIWHKNQKCRQRRDGSVYLSFESNQIQQALFWVLSFGSSVQVLNPPELVEKYKDELRKMLEKNDLG